MPNKYFVDKEKRQEAVEDPDTFWRPTRMPGTEAKAKLFLKNQTGKKVYLCCGKSEYTLEQNQSIEIEIQDGDCMYLDYVWGKQRGGVAEKETPAPPNTKK